MSTTRIVPTTLIVSLAVLGAAACSAGRTTTQPVRPVSPTTTEPSPPAPTTSTAATTEAPSPPTTVTTTPPPAPARPTAPVDALVPTAPTGARLHLRCAGSGPSTVLLIAGFGNGADTWSAVAPTVSEQARVCSYDRFGTGTSDAPPADQTFATEASDLHDLLATSGEIGPYVVVGHSFGGAEAVEFTSRYADEVDGLLLLDASPTDWPSAVCAVPDDGSQGAAVYRATCAALSSPSQNPERLDVATAFPQVGAISTLGAVPLVVETRADLTQPGLAAAIDEQLADVWRAGQDHWAALSSSSRVVRVAQTSHNIQVDQPQAVIDQVVSLLPQPGA